LIAQNKFLLMPIDGKIKANEDFWINLSAETIYGSSERVAKAADTLKTVITWAFGVFSVGGFTLTVFGDSLKDYNQTALLLFGFAFALLTIAQILIARAQSPFSKKYLDTDPVEIKKTFSEATVTQIRAFRLAMGVSFTGFLLLAIGILVQFANLKTKEKDIKEPVVLLLKTGIEKRSDTISIPVTVQFKANAPIQVTITNLTVDPAKPVPESSPVRLLYNNVFYTDTSGRMYFSYRLDTTLVKTVLVKATAREKDSAGNLEEIAKLVTVKISN
jgi:hypothetical protein